MGQEALAVDSKLCEGSKCKFRLHLVETIEIGVVWDVQGVYTALPNGRGRVARFLLYATGSLYTWSLWSGLCPGTVDGRGGACVHVSV